MDEKFLHFVWASLGFDPRNLKTADGQAVKIHQRGVLNPNQGPDFLGARIQLGYPQFAGAVEIHCTTQDWYAHGHEKDKRYNSVVLHVVGKSNGEKVYRQDGSEIPEISLEGLIAKEVISRYEVLKGTQSPILCANLLHEIDPPSMSVAMDALGIERIQQKALQLKDRQSGAVYHWQQMVWEELCRAVGGKVNGDAFAEMAARIPVEWVSRLRGDRMQLEALLMGVADILPLESSDEPYVQDLQAAWQYFKIKYSINPSPIPVRYLRMRPNSFPPIRISQIAGILSRYPTLIELMLEESMADFLASEIETTEYWKSHVKFGECTIGRVKRMGMEVKRSVVINALLPMAGLYYAQHGLETYNETTVNILERLAAEDNQVIRMFEPLGLKANNALRSQGLLQLKKSYCDLKNCLNCRLGQKILTNKKVDNGANTYSNRGNRGRSKDRIGHFEHAGSNCARLPDNGGG